MKTNRISALTAALLLGLASMAFGSTQHGGSLAGMARVGIYFDVNVDVGEVLALRMKLIERTLRQVRDQVKRVDVVIGFRGGATRFLTRDELYLDKDELAARDSVQRAVKSFMAEGATVEQCAIAAELRDIPVDDFIDGVRVVPNGYVAMIAYQAGGYSLVPMD